MGTASHRTGANSPSSSFSSLSLRNFGAKPRSFFVFHSKHAPFFFLLWQRIAYTQHKNFCHETQLSRESHTETKIGNKFNTCDFQNGCDFLPKQFQFPSISVTDGRSSANSQWRGVFIFFLSVVWMSKVF
mgnify:CR=1 FL=1